ncbi:MAG: MBL fold metallo-hydrolase [Candidatus Anstonellales archaeon]
MNNEDITFTAFGGAKEIGRSCYMLEKDGKAILLDAGIKVVKNNILMPDIDKNNEFDSVILSHAHTDHVGMLPLIKFNTAYATKPTKELSKLLWADQKKLTGLFDNRLINDAYSKIKAVEYRKPFSLNHVFKAEFFEAGHILGSAMTLINDKILYTGDFNTSASRILNPALPVKADVIILEGTYLGGENKFLPKKELIKQFSSIVNNVLNRNGCIIIPCFAIGRAQEILITLEALIRSGIIKKVPIYIDGMIKKAMKIYRQNVIYAREEIKMRILASLDDPFMNPLFKVSRHKKRADIKKPCIIVSTSGMLNGGPIFHYLNLLANDDKNMILFVGYQAEGSKGAEIINGKRLIETDYGEIHINAEVQQIRFPGHAQHDELIRFVRTIKPKKAIFVHCERNIESLLSSELKDIEFIIPSINENIKL